MNLMPAAHVGATQAEGGATPSKTVATSFLWHNEIFQACTKYFGLLSNIEYWNYFGMTDKFQACSKYFIEHEPQILKIFGMAKILNI